METFVEMRKWITAENLFDGQIYDAFSLLIDLVASATKSLVLVDNYVDVGTLNILPKKKENASQL